ncbi:iron reductase [Suillus fuscotomentosus]|uniref:Iron reductase n=1 Tax=Suillus fuscotomentosus TaxID=1912939 RepID=A0AAD4E2P7_9AGAM|nr:iron reductase [Suillus fuscotomentosus]KAG1897198.1 iron reductase [Suillus fuscotomentosus]
MAAPVVPSSFQIYNSYVEDPQWQIKFTIIWCSGVTLAVAVSIPSVVLGLRHGRPLKGITGISETEPPPTTHRRGRRLVGAWNALISLTYWSPPKLGLNVGQIIVLLAYLTAVLVCIIKDAPLMSNPNRAGEISRSRTVFLFATKNSILSLLLGPGNGHEKLNFMHRMAGRAMFLAACIHGFLWIRNRLQYGLAILGPQKETLGVASLALLCIIVLTSLRPVRRLFYECFFIIHILIYVAFVVAMCYHTPYASPWIFPPLTFCGVDILLRLFRYRIKAATLTAQGTHMTMIRVHNCDDGWLAGQHVRLRVLFSSRGDSGAFVQVILDGPYGGSSVDLGLYESAFLIAGGSGITFTLGLLDDIVGRCVRLGRSQGERTRRIEFTWCIRSFEWFVPILIDIATAASNSTVDLHTSVFITCSQACDPEAVLHIPNSIVTLSRPAVHNLLRDFIKINGVAVCASGPESLTRDV